MITSAIHAYYHPTTVVVIDDNQLFLRGLDLELPDGKIYQLHHEPESALEVINASHHTRPLADRVFTVPRANPDMSFATVALDLSLIEQEIKLVDRFRRVSVAVIDYSMPSMDGIEVCKAITNRSVKRLLLTGVADEKLAVAAFNDGLIDQFLAKQSVTALDTVFHCVDLLVKQYFDDVQARLHHALGATLAVYNENTAFVRYFHDYMATHGIVEYYGVGDPAGFLLVDASGQLRRMLITTRAEQTQQADWAEARDAPADVVRDLRNGDLIGYFIEPPETFFEGSGFEWRNYIYAATRVDSGLHVAIIDDPPTDIDFHPELTSYDACAKKLSKTTTMTADASS